MTRWTPSIGGDEFDGLECNLDKELSNEHLKNRGDTPPKGDREEGEQSDRTITKIVVVTALACIVTGLAVSGAYGLATGEWKQLHYVWLIAAAPFDAIFTKYVGDFNEFKSPSWL